MSMGALIEKFRTVGLERIEQMNSLLVTLERRPDDSERVDELMREIHTLKGEAKMMGFADINLVAHQTENLLLVAIDGGKLVDTEPIDLIFEGLDLMRGLLTKSTGKSKKNLDLNDFIDRLSRFDAGKIEQSPSAESTSDESAPEPTDASKSDSIIDTTSDSAEDEPSAHEPSESTTDAAIVDRPAPDSARGTGHQTPQASESPEQPFPRNRSTRTRIQSIRSKHDDDDQTGALRIQTSSSLRVEVEKLERMGDMAGETLLMSRRLDYHLDELKELRQDLRRLLEQVGANLPKSRTRTLRELIHQFDACETALREDNYLVNLRASQVDDQARHLRHLPLAQVLSHYPRAVRDLAKAQGKQVRLVHTFGNVEVDRTILSALSEPLLHLVRNAVDHGIEPPDERTKTGKEPEGEISLSADYYGDSIRVELRDDGRGIDPDNVRQKAVERQFFSSDKAAHLSDQEAIALIFEPGFSTQADVSDISGRGIGMDVVRRQITRIGGFIEVESEVGEGTTFRLHLPISSAVNAVLIFCIEDRHFALTAKDVERVAMVQRDQLESAHGGICLRLNGELIPLVDWAELLDLQNRGRPPEQMTVLIVRKGTRRIAVWIDEVIGEREAISRPLDEFMTGVNRCRGVALTDSGDVVPLLNGIEMVEQSAGQSHVELGAKKRRSYTSVQRQRSTDVYTILVVEDSEVTRSLVVSILKNRNYRILEADDGNHGWHMLQRHKVDLVLSDIQMPGMNGLQLLETIRSSPQYANLPVIILTTLGEPEDKKRAMRLGANGYLVKLSFQEEDLLETVARYID